MAETSKHPMIRWALPALAVAAIGVATVAPRAVADPALPPRTAEQLLVDLQTAEVDAFSGTVETRSDLGLPALPLGDSDFAALTAGTNTLRVWQAGDEKSRVSLIGDGAEASVIRNGDDVWQWSSTTRTAKHAVLTDEHAEPQPSGTHTPRSPQEAAEHILATIEPTTAVTVSQTTQVAGRDAYELVLDPKSDDTLVAKVAIAVDAETQAPLRVEIWAIGADQPALRVGFTQVDFAAPDDSVFTFSPPAGTTVEQLDAGDEPARAHDRDGLDKPEPTVVGEGWDRVVVTALPETTHETPTPEPGQGDELQQVLEQLPTVQGPWGSGRVLSSALVTVVLTDDGRMAVGMVPTERVVAAIPQ